MPDPRHLIGLRGEEMAAEWLTSRGWSILARRWRCAAGELDLVALDPDAVLVGVEVKLRRSARVGDPLESIDRQRLRRLRGALGQFQATPGIRAGNGLRIDLVAISGLAAGGWRLKHHAAIDAW